jgi:hypothetical protein
MFRFFPLLFLSYRAVISQKARDAKLDILVEMEEKEKVLEVSAAEEAKLKEDSILMAKANLEGLQHMFDDMYV